MNQVGVSIKAIANANPAYVRRTMEVNNLARDLNAHGPKIPVLTTSDFLVIDGARRLEAATQLGWDEYPTIATDDWWTVFKHMIRTLDAEKNGATHERMSWLEIDDLIHRILEPVYRKARRSGPMFMIRRAEYFPESIHLHTKSRSRFALDLEKMLGYIPSDISAIRAAGNLVRNARDPALRELVIKTIVDEENASGRIWAMYAAARRTADVGLYVPSSANAKLAEGQVKAFERAMTTLDQVTQELDKLRPLNPGIPLETATRLLAELRHIRRRGSNTVVALRVLVNQLEQRSGTASTVWPKDSYDGE